MASLPQYKNPQTAPLKSIPPDLKTYRDTRMMEELDLVHNELERVSASDVPRLAERIFVGVFLPLFAGDEKLHYPVDFLTWVNRVANSPYREVAVIDPKGEVLFMVPPLYDRTGVNAVPNTGRVPISHVMTTAGQYAMMAPQVGYNYLTQQLHDRATVMRVPANVLKHLEAWNKIFVRYGRPPLMEVKETSSGVTATKVDDGPEQFDFEPL